MRIHSVNKEYHGEHIKNENKHYCNMEIQVCNITNVVPLVSKPLKIIKVN